MSHTLRIVLTACEQKKIFWMSEYLLRNSFTVFFRNGGKRFLSFKFTFEFFWYFLWFDSALPSLPLVVAIFSWKLFGFLKCVFDKMSFICQLNRKFSFYVVAFENMGFCGTSFLIPIAQPLENVKIHFKC